MDYIFLRGSEFPTLEIHKKKLGSHLVRGHMEDFSGLFYPDRTILRLSGREES